MSSLEEAILPLVGRRQPLLRECEEVHSMACIDTLRSRGYHRILGIGQAGSERFDVQSTPRETGFWVRNDHYNRKGRANQTAEPDGYVQEKY